jgi:TrmH family RNA methyltransferase
MISHQEHQLSKAEHSAPGRLRRIEGRHNSLLKELRQAFSRGELTSSGECAVEGFRIIEEAMRSGLKLRAVFVSESGQDRAARILPQIGMHVETALLPDKLFAAVAPSKAPQGIAALVQVKKHSYEAIVGNGLAGPVLVAAGLQDPGNLGTMLRSAEAFGAKGVLLGEGTVSAFNSKVVRGSAGSIFRLPVAKVELKSAIADLRARSIVLIATSSHKGTPLPECDLSGETAILVGSEGAGLDKRLLSEMDRLIRIPHSPRVESLNAGIAVSIVLYEASRQRAGAAKN